MLPFIFFFFLQTVVSSVLTPNLVFLDQAALAHQNSLDNFKIYFLFKFSHNHKGMQEAIGHERLGVQWASKVCQGLLLLILEHVNTYTYR